MGSQKSQTRRSTKQQQQYHNQKIDIDTIQPSYSDFSSVTYTSACVCVFSSMQFYHLCRLVCSLVGKESAYSAGDPGLIPGWEDSLEKEMATHSSVLA